MNSIATEHDQGLENKLGNLFCAANSEPKLRIAFF